MQDNLDNNSVSLRQNLMSPKEIKRNQTDIELNSDYIRAQIEGENTTDDRAPVQDYAAEQEMQEEQKVEVMARLVADENPVVRAKAKN